MSRAVLNEQFGDLDSCFVAMVEDLLQRGSVTVFEAVGAEPRWEDSVIAGLEALLVFLDSEPTCAQACLLESMSSLPAEFESRNKVLGRLGGLFDQAARRGLSLERQPPAVMSEATVVAVLGLLRRRLLSGDAPPFVPMLGQLAAVVVAPYQGPRAAQLASERAEARARELLEARPEPALPDVDIPRMLRHGGAHRMRLCMRFLASHPGASNQGVADGIGVAHGGQVSALLARLHRAGLLAKECGGAGRPNSWRLTPHGIRVERALHVR